MNLSLLTSADGKRLESARCAAAIRYRARLLSQTFHQHTFDLQDPPPLLFSSWYAAGEGNQVNMEI